MTEFKLFKLHCFVLDGLTRKEKTVHLNPTFVVSIERYEGMTKIMTTNGDFYPPLLDTLIIKGLSDIHRINHKMIRSN